MKAVKAFFVAIVVAAGMLVIPASPAAANRYCVPPPPNAGSVTQDGYDPSGIGRVDPRYTIPQYLEWVVKDADQMWTQWFLSNGLCEPEVGYELVGYTSQKFVSKCTDPKTKQYTVATPTFPNAFYCTRDSVVASGHLYQGMVVLPVTTFRKMWYGNIFNRRSAVMGDFAAGTIVAHEFGHHIQDELSQQLNWKHPTGKLKELIADCFAGVWAYSINARGQLEYGDLDELVAGLAAIGDPEVTTNSHGTAQERVKAAGVGFNSGNPMACIKTYWK